MSFKATLTLQGDKEFNLIECTSVFLQKTDMKGRPVSGVRGGKIRMIVQGTDDDTIARWATDRTKKMDGKITYYKIWQHDSKFREIDFKGAYVTGFMESYYGDEDEEGEMVDDAIEFGGLLKQRENTRLLTLHKTLRISYLFMIWISAESIKVDEVEHDNNW